MRAPARVPNLASAVADAYGYVNYKLVKISAGKYVRRSEQDLIRRRRWALIDKSCRSKTYAEKSKLNACAEKVRSAEGVEKSYELKREKHHPMQELESNQQRLVVYLAEEENQASKFGRICKLPLETTPYAIPWGRRESRHQNLEEFRLDSFNTTKQGQPDLTKRTTQAKAGTIGFTSLLRWESDMPNSTYTPQAMVKTQLAKETGEL
ncbi:hypothetical protein U1Q18_047166 [Sarracenia purpurea var. burkii]